MSLLSIAQIVISVLLIIAVLLQERSSGAGGLFGGGGDGGYYQARRGMEKVIFGGTLVLLTLFALVSLVNLVI